MFSWKQNAKARYHPDFPSIQRLFLQVAHLESTHAFFLYFYAVNPILVLLTWVLCNYPFRIMFTLQYGDSHQSTASVSCHCTSSTHRPQYTLGLKMNILWQFSQSSTHISHFFFQTHKNNKTSEKDICVPTGMWEKRNENF